jgi:hypothetical protein
VRLELGNTIAETSDDGVLLADDACAFALCRDVVLLRRFECRLKLGNALVDPGDDGALLVRDARALVLDDLRLLRQATDVNFLAAELLLQAQHLSDCRVDDLLVLLHRSCEGGGALVLLRCGRSLSLEEKYKKEQKALEKVPKRPEKEAADKEKKGLVKLLSARSSAVDDSEHTGRDCHVGGWVTHFECGVDVSRTNV